MADPKGTHSRKKRTSQLTRFPVKGKIVESVQASADAITILFQDRTALSFDLDAGLTVFPELSGWKTGDWRGIKRWRPLHSKTSLKRVVQTYLVVSCGPYLTELCPQNTKTCRAPRADAMRSRSHCCLSTLFPTSGPLPPAFPTGPIQCSKPT